MSNNAKRIGLWGGSFNPPTLAHKALAEYAFSALELDQLHWIVTPHNPEKDETTLAPFQHRLAMVDQVLEIHPDMNANDIEQRNGSSWTINTVKTLRQEMPDDYLFFMMGTDNWLGFHGWGDNFSEIFNYVSLVVFNRPGMTSNEQAEASRIFADRRVNSPDGLKKSGSWFILDNPEYDMSATQVRTLLAAGELPHQIAPETLDYIIQQDLYKKVITSRDV